MRFRFVPAAVAVLAACHATAAPLQRSAADAGGPKQIGKFDDWTAVTRQERGDTVCYAFAYPVASVPAVAGRGRPALTVTERPSGRDAVAFSAGLSFPPDTETTLQVDQAGHAFYTAGRFAFARDGSAVVAALRRGRQATIRTPRARNAQVTDTFSLRGFDQAYDAVTKACPVR